QSFEHRHAGCPGVEAGQYGKVLAAGAEKAVAAADRELLQSLEAIGGETRRRHCKTFRSGPGLFGQHRVGRGLEPLGLSETRLERRREAQSRACQRSLEQARRLAAMAMIGIAEMQRALGRAVEAE